MNAGRGVAATMKGTVALFKEDLRGLG